MTKQQDLAAQAEAEKAAADKAAAEQAEAEKAAAEKAAAEKAAAAAAAASKGKTVKARVLVSCPHGEPDDLVEIGEAEAKKAQAAGQVDTHKEAVAYAATLPQNAKA
jgi:hypothetical protein